MSDNWGRNYRDRCNIFGGLVQSKSIRVAGDMLDRNIIDYMKKNFNLLIGDRVAEDLKIKTWNGNPA